MGRRKSAYANIKNVKLELEIVKASESETIKKMIKYRDQVELMTKALSIEKQNNDNLKIQYEQELYTKVSSSIVLLYR